MVDYKYKDLFKENSVDKQMVIEYGSTIVTNTDLFSQEMTLDESLCSQGQLVFGSCEASMFKCRIANIVAPMKGQWITVKLALKDHADSPFVLGRYKVQSDKLTADKQWRDIVAYDAIYDILETDVADWYNTVLPHNDSTITMRQFRASFTAHFGLEEAETELVNDDMVIHKTIQIVENSETDTASTIGEVLSGKEVIQSICEINGCFGHIGRDGRFHYIYLQQAIQGLYPADTLYPADNLYPREPKGERIGKGYYTACNYEDFVTPSIDKLQIRMKENDIGAVIGDGDNCYVIEDNFLVYGKSGAELEAIGRNILGKIRWLEYRPFDASCTGNPCLEVGDPIRIATRHEIVESYILSRTIKGIQALRDSYSSKGVEKYSECTNPLKRSILQLKGKSNVLERTIEETRLELSDLETYTTATLTMHSNEIDLRVTKSGVVAAINLSPETVTIEAKKIDLKGLGNAQELTSKFATITTLDAVSARVGSLEADHVTTAQLNATNAAVAGKLSAADLEAVNITAKNLKVESANIKGGFNADKITAGTISVERLDVDGLVTGLSGKAIQCVSFTARSIRGSSYQLWNGNSYSQLSLKTVKIGDTTYRLLGE